MQERRALLVVADLLVRTRLEEAARADGITVTARRRLAGPLDAPPDVVVVDLDLAGVLDDLPAWREQYPDVPVTGFVFHIDAERRAAAEALGVTVVPHGATARDPRSLFG